MQTFYPRTKPGICRWLTSLALVILTCGSAWAQQRITLTGVVTDAKDGAPLVGVAIVVKSTTQGTITEADGTFTLDADPDGTLVISFIGYQAQEIRINSRTRIEVMLEPSAESLEEFVVVGFGTQKKANLSGATDIIDGSITQSRSIQNVAQGLQGAVPNLNVDFLSGEPGSTPNINIRGIASINGAGGAPLIIIDNLPVTVADLNFLAPSDVKSYTVLKDAASAAIYGARAANGVILITTKSGTKEGTTVEYSNNFSWSRPTMMPDKVTDPYIYMRTLETSTDNTPWDYVNYSDELYAWAKERSDNPSASGPVRINPLDNTQWEYMGNRDWTKHLLNNLSFSQRQNLSISGRSGTTSYYLSGSYDSQSGTLRIAEDLFDRYSMRGKVSFKPVNWLTVSNNTSMALTERSKPYFMSIENIYNLFPTSWNKNPDGTWANNDVGILYAQLTDGGRISERMNMFQTTLSGEVSLLDNMVRLNSDLSVRRDNTNYRSNQNKYRIGFGPNRVEELGDNIAYRDAGFLSYYVWNTYATVEKKTGKHYGNVIVGYNQEFSQNEMFGVSRSGVISTALPTIDLATGIPNVYEDIGEWALRGVFYRFNYVYNDKYIAEFNGRYDGSSKFPSDKRFVFVPSVSAAWRVDNERLWEPVKPVVDAFKIRASYGSLGNQTGVGNYVYQETALNYPGNYLIDGAVPQVVTAPVPVSTNYSWEKIQTLNLGTDLGFFQQRLTASFDIYKRKTKDMLAPGRELPGVFGADEPVENAADLETKGWELALAYDDEYTVGGKPLHFNARFILADSRTFITRFDNPSGSLTQFYKGKELGEIWGLTNDGFFTSQEEIDALDQTAIIPWGALTVTEGWPKYVDRDGNGAIEKGATIHDPKDLSRIGNITPRYRFSVNLGADWNGFDFRMLLQAVGKMDYYPLHYLYWGYYQQPYAGGYSHLMDFYRAEGDSDIEREQHSQSYIDAGLADANTDAQYPVLQAWLADRNLGERIDQAQGLAIPQTKYLLNGAYLRVKNITLGYTLPNAWLERYGIKRLRVYASGENLFEFSEVKKYFDPEAITDNISKLDPGAETSSGWGYAYPFTRRYSFGLEMQF
jgi:TonB-linked SusC/RagA family outer membrane protein